MLVLVFVLVFILFTSEVDLSSFTHGGQDPSPGRKASSVTPNLN